MSQRQAGLQRCSLSSSYGSFFALISLPLLLYTMVPSPLSPSLPPPRSPPQGVTNSVCTRCLLLDPTSLSFSRSLRLGFSLKEAMHHTPQLHNSRSLRCLCVEQQKADLKNILTVENCLVLFFLSHLKGTQTSIHLFYFSPSSLLLRVANSSCYK